MTVAVYVRVSTQRQAQAQTIEQQLERLRAHLRGQGVELASEKVFRDDGCSGATLNRPGLDRLRDAVRAGEVDRLLVTDPDRLARNYVQLMVLLEELERAGCEVAFLDRPMSRDPQDQLLLQIRGAVAEYERTLIAERMRRGRQAKLRAGCLLPWTRPPYGYRLDPDRPRDPAGVTLEPAEAAVVRELFAGYLEDHASLFSLAKHLHALGIASPRGRPRWSPATRRGLLTNPTYTGQAYAGRWRARAPRIRRSATHPIGKPSDSSVPVPAAQWLPVASIPALVNEEQFAQAQAKLARNRAFARRHNTAHTYLLRALVSCGLCRSGCLCRTIHPGYAYYTCRGKGDPVHSHRDEPCRARYAPAAQLDALVWRDLCELLTHPEHVAQALARAHGGGWLPQELQARREQLRQARLGLERQLERLTEAYPLAVIPLPEYQRRRRALEQRLQALDAQAGRLEAQVDRQAELAGWATSAADFCRRVRAGLAAADFARKRQLAELLIDRVLVSDGEVEIRYVIPLSPGTEKVRFCHLRKDYFDLPPLVIQRRQLGRRRLGGIQDRRDQPVERLGAGHPLQPVLDRPHPDAPAPVPAVLLARVDRAQEGAVGQPLLAWQPQVALHPPEQVGAGRGSLPPERVAEERPVGQTKHPGPQRRHRVMGQRRLAVGETAQPSAEQDVRAVLDQRHETQLGESARAAAGLGTPEGGAVLLGVGHVQAGPVQADQPPLTVPRALGGGHRDRPRHPLVQATQRRLAQAGAGLRDAALARHLDRLGAPEPAQSLQEAAQDLAGAGAGVERQRDGVVDHDVGRQVALALARLAGLGQDLTHLVEREGPGDPAETDVVAEADAGGQAGASTSHRCRSRENGRQRNSAVRLTERYWD